MIRTDDASLGRLLSDLDKWDLPEEAWAVVGASLTALARAARDGDLTALRQAVGDIEYWAPPRARTQPGPRCTTIPPELREQRNVLVHELKLDLGISPAEDGSGPEAEGAPAAEKS